MERPEMPEHKPYLGDTITSGEEVAGWLRELSSGREATTPRPRRDRSDGESRSDREGREPHAPTGRGVPDEHGPH
jgi:hypothetical protein